MSGERRFTVGAEDVGERLDRFLARRLELGRGAVKRWLETSRVTVDGRPAKGSQRIAESSEVVCAEPPPEEPEEIVVEPEPGPLEVLWEDRHLAVIVKPAGMAVHPGAGRERGTLAHRLLARYPRVAGVGEADRPGIVHRLDKDTTGLLVAALDLETHEALSRAFAERRVEKTYLAIAYGVPEDEGRIELPIGRHPRERQRMSVRPEGREARTAWRTLRVSAGLALLELDLETGRTHQIRVHLKALGHPLVGDPVYGEARWRGLPKEVRPPLEAFPRPALHAWRLAFEHPLSGEKLHFEAPVPEDLRALWRRITGEELRVGEGDET